MTKESVNAETTTETDCAEEKLTIFKLNNIKTSLPPELEGKSKGDSGRICIIGGSTEYSGAPYFAAVSSLKVRNYPPTYQTGKPFLPLLTYLRTYP